METILEAISVCECGSRSFVSDDTTGDITCTRCGLVSLEKESRQFISYKREKQDESVNFPSCQLCNAKVTTSDIQGKRYSSRKYCSSYCRKLAHYLRKTRGWVPGQYRLLVRKRKCPVCGGEVLETNLRNRLYDSEKCARMAQNRRYREKHWSAAG